jgi:hypothetical protein
MKSARLLAGLAVCLGTALNSSIAEESADQSLNYTYTTNNNTITITGYTGTGGEVTIPSTIDGLLVTQIGARAFLYCSSLTSIIIPNRITTIGDYVFRGCSNLTSITIPDSVTRIGSVAFGSCTRLTGVYFKGNAPSIGAGAFDGDNKATVYYLAGTTGWGPIFADRLTRLWNLHPAPIEITVKTVQVTMHLTPTKKYQLQSSLDLVAWTNIGDPFVASTSEVVQEFNAMEVGRYFLLSEIQ